MNKLAKLARKSKTLDNFLNSLRSFGKYYLDSTTLLWNKNDFITFYLSVKGGN
jgi:hypothetical protein